MYTSHKQIILASASPRRIELLEQIGLDAINHPSDFVELLDHQDPRELVKHNSFGKAQKLLRSYRNALIIGVDTIGLHRGRILGKPKTEEDAREILRSLSQSTHEVLSAITIIRTHDEKAVTAVESTKVTVGRLDENDISAYLASKEGHDKAAGYAIQGLGALFIKSIEGDYFNVVGLPIYLLRNLLQEFGVKHWWRR